MQQDRNTMQHMAQNLSQDIDQEHDCLVWLTHQDVASLSHHRVASLTRRLASGLAASNIGPEQRVALFADNRWQTVVLALGIMQAGAVVTPLDPQMQGTTLTHVLEDAKPSLVLADRQQQEAVRQALGKDAHSLRMLDSHTGLQTEASAGTWHELLQDEGVEPERVELDDTAALFYTSGTTGKPKGVPLSHANLAFQQQALREAGLVSPGDRILLPLPLHHVYPFVAGMLVPLALGLTIVLPHSLSGGELIRASRAARTSVLIGVPRLYEALVSGIERRISSRGFVSRSLARGLLALSDFCRRKCHRRWGKTLLASLHKQLGPELDILASGGAPLSEDTAWRLEALGWRVAIGYGLTETSPILTVNPPGSSHFGAVGRALPGVELRIAPLEHGQAPGEGKAKTQGDTQVTSPAQDAQSGEIQAKGPPVFSGYRNLPGKTGDSFTPDGWFRTGDIGRLENGWLIIEGRVSTMIVTTSGENVQPDNVEAVLDQHPLLKETGVLEHEGGLAVVAVPDLEAARQQGVAPETAARLGVREAARKLPSHQRPAKVVVSLQPLDRTRLGKIRRHLLQARFQDIISGATPQQKQAEAPALSEEDRELLQQEAPRRTWEVLEKRFPDSSLHPDMELAADLGLDSMAWLDLSMELAEHADFEPREQDIDSLVTVRDLLQFSLQAAGQEQSAGDPVRTPLDYLGEQQRAWAEPVSKGRLLVYASLHRLLSPLFRMVFRIKTTGLEQVASVKEPLVITPNHLSYLDIFVLIAVLPFPMLRRTHPAAWSGAAFANRFLGFFSRTTQAFPVGGLHRLGTTLAIGAGILDQGRNLIWFPEGMRSPDGKMLDFQPGLGRILAARKEQVRVVPVCIRGTFEAMPKGSWRIRPAKVRVAFGESIAAAELVTQEQDAEKAIMEALRERMLQLCEEA